jgi:uncharacterized membrane protein YedE/YeeE
MDLVPLIDSVGENGAALAGGAALGLVFGYFAQRTAFCTRTAVLDVARGQGAASLATWMAGFAVAVLGVQLLLAQGRLDVTETRFFATPQSLSGALVGGALFGIGMVLARGCVSRLLVLGSSGNLRAAFTLTILAVVALATYDGFLSPVRDAIAGLASTADVGGNDLVALSGIGASGGLAIGIVLALAALGLAVAARVSPLRFAGGAAVGATIVGGWYFTWQLSQQVFEPIQAESLSYVRPLATTVQLGIGSDGAAGLDQGVLIGIILGAFIAAAASRQFRVATFSEPGTPSILRYTAGAALMGFGGILAVGCTIGAGFTGGAVLALSSILGLVSMMASAVLADRLIDAPRSAGAAAGKATVAAK